MSGRANRTNRGGTATSPGRGRGNTGAQWAQTNMRYRPHLGEFPKIVLPQGADGARITHMNGVTYAEYHFPHLEGDSWIPASSLNREQSRSFDLHLSASAGRLNPPVVLTAAENFLGDTLPAVLGRPVAEDAALGAAWWKSHLKPEVYSRIFPAPTGVRRPPSSSEGGKAAE